MRKVFFFLAAALLPYLFETSQAMAKDMTRLQVISGPEGVFRTLSGTTKITSVTAKIKNIGTITAKEIEVYAILPSGSRTRLFGPFSLDKYESSTYKGTPSDTVLSEQKIQVEINCANCR
jgi:hypothetical protein